MKKHQNKKRLLKAAGTLLALLLCACIFTSCSKRELDIDQNFPFEVQVMPVPKTIGNGQTVEIRITIITAGYYSGTDYYLRYFQYDGTGILRYNNDTPYQPNDLYRLPGSKQFRLYYTSTSKESQSFDVWISDNFGNEKQLNFRFNSNEKEILDQIK